MHNNYCSVLLFSHTDTSIFSTHGQKKRQKRHKYVWDDNVKVQSKIVLMPHSFLLGCCTEFRRGYTSINYQKQKQKSHVKAVCEALEVSAMNFSECVRQVRAFD